MTKNIFIDMHHSSLFSSFLYTLETRLGYTIYRGVGEAWFKNGYWKINRQADTIQQYLGTYGYQPLDGTPSLNNVMWMQDDVYYSRDPNTGQIHKAITYEKFMSMEWYTVICSIPQHIEPYKELAKIKKCYHIFQVGNEFNFDYESVPNLMASIMPRPIKAHHVFYCQEFDTTAFNPKPPNHSKKIYNFMNVLKNYPEALDLFLALEAELPDYDFKMFGSQNRDGCITGVQEIAAKIAEAQWIFHVKPGGDGYGHLVHNFYAIGRPLLTKKTHYEGKLAGRMMKESNAILVDSRNPKNIADLIRSHEDASDSMAENAHKTFNEYVDFSADAQRIKQFMDTLV